MIRDNHPHVSIGTSVIRDNHRHLSIGIPRDAGCAAETRNSRLDSSEIYAKLYLRGNGFVNSVEGIVIEIVLCRRFRVLKFNENHIIYVNIHSLL